MKIEIRQWIPEDNETFLEWADKDPSILKSLGAEGLDRFDLRKLLVLSAANANMHRFMACRDGEPVAAISIYDVRADGTAFGSIVGNPDASGLATVRASQEALRVGFNGFGLTNLHFQVAETNTAAQKLLNLIGAEDTGMKSYRLKKEEFDE